MYIVCWLVISFWLFRGAYHYDRQAPTFPPVAAEIYANHFNVYPHNDPLYPNRSVSNHHPYLRHLLNHWIHFSEVLGFRYVAIAGTLLGAMRNGHIIPWDSDMDVAVDRETGEKITLLAAGHPESGMSRSSFDGLSIEFNNAVIDHQPWTDGEVRLIVNRYLALDLPGGNGPHFNRTGHLVPDQEDSVSFAALFARLVSYVDRRYAHIDIFCTEEFDGKYGWQSVEVGPSKATFPKRVEPCAFEGRMIWCPSKEDYDPIMQNNYGNDYMVPHPPS
ncbi:uncharacterized protein ACA1_222090 [Acanthamoeba castellanii str. Neff]|uniref:LicD/FKTN/FKRP nucleotidyltransferase domain-containing protein n=1 Tax=Acanthamoeba castellanii (strain ATCC 30010 / Neff) TaxID=1257118 RepID=L8GTR2_ACACF|nr:uncharacterized protein ACA1_222090 [Acanthamoeba castellanii str. Neff]ELR15993.1 hypothetical protein ACA1_222090 [Acanthamoeba castellanii str. Neff]